MTTHKDLDVRRGSIAVLGGLKDARTHAPLARGLKDFFTRDAAKKALIRTGPPAEKEVLALIDDPESRDAVIAVLKEIGTQESVPALQQLAQQRQGGFGSTAEEALKSINARAQK